MYLIYGDYGYTSETLLEEFESYAEAVRWCEGFTMTAEEATMLKEFLISKGY